MKNIGKYILWVVFCLAVASCSEHDLDPLTTTDRQISFAVEEVSQWDAPENTRVATALFDKDIEPIRIETGTNQPLYLHTMIAPWHAETSGGGNTRSTLTTTENLTEFGVSGVHYDPSTESLASLPPNFFHDVNVTFDGTKWTSHEPYYWPVTPQDKMAFYAWSPYTTSSTSIQSVTPATRNGPVILSFKVDTDVANQVDLITAKEENQTFDNSLSNPTTLHFSHDLTAINFMVGQDMTPSTINKIRLLNIITEGEDTIGGGWKLTTVSNPVEIDLTTTGGHLTSDPDSNITHQSKNTTLLMIPQEFNNNNQEIEVYFNTGVGVDKHPTATLNGTKWDAGTIVTYKISTSAYNTISVSTVTYPTTWGTESIQLESYYANQKSIGIFAVNKTTGEIVNSNVEYQYNSSTGTWTPVTTEVNYKKGYDYYAYYPYESTVPATLAATQTKIVNSAASNWDQAKQFFTDLIATWGNGADQSTVSKLLQYDHHICKASNPGTSAITFPMSHAMGLEVIKLSHKSETVTARYYNTAENSYFDIPKTVTIHASDDFDGNQPYKCVDGETCYFVMVPGTNETFDSQKTLSNQWTAAISRTIANPGESATDIAYMDNTKLSNAVIKGWYYECTNSIQSQVLPKSGPVILEVWGAQGGGNQGLVKDYYFVEFNEEIDPVMTPVGGSGGYSIGTTNQMKGTTLYIGVGGKGDTVGARRVTNSANFYYHGIDGGYNGGGKAGTVRNADNYNGSGGGATHIATATGVLSSLSSNQSAVLIVGGGGGGSYYFRFISSTKGSYYYDHYKGGCGGGLTGGSAEGLCETTASTATNYTAAQKIDWVGTGGEQTPYSGGATDKYIGSFGQGAQEPNDANYTKQDCPPGGGGGWYGGNSGWLGAGGGSSYISGLSDSNTIDGNNTQPANQTNSTQTGQSGDGFARLLPTANLIQ